MSFDLNSIERTQGKTYDGTVEFQYKYNHYDTNISFPFSTKETFGSMPTLIGTLIPSVVSIWL